MAENQVPKRNKACPDAYRFDVSKINVLRTKSAAARYFSPDSAKNQRQNSSSLTFPEKSRPLRAAFSSRKTLSVPQNPLRQTLFNALHSSHHLEKNFEFSFSPTTSLRIRQSIPRFSHNLGISHPLAKPTLFFSRFPRFRK
jgi:hypothetical protein